MKEKIEIGKQDIIDDCLLFATGSETKECPSSPSPLSHGLSQSITGPG